MKKLCCLPCPPEPPNLNLDFKCVSACCGGNAGPSNMKTEEASDEVDNALQDVTHQAEEEFITFCCCKRRRKTQAKDTKSGDSKTL